jgi:hypothetical protein
MRRVPVVVLVKPVLVTALSSISLIRTYIEIRRLEVHRLIDSDPDVLWVPLPRVNWGLLYLLFDFR